jgi:hypothetical protein
VIYAVLNKDVPIFCVSMMLAASMNALSPSEKANSPPMKKKYYYPSDAGDTYYVAVATHLAAVAGLQEIPKGAKLPPDCESILNYPRYVWAKALKPSSPSSTARIKLVVQSDNPLYRSCARQDVLVNGVQYVTTGRVGEGMTFESDSPELLKELSKPQQAQSAYPQRSIKCYSYTGDDGMEYTYSGAEYLAVAAGLRKPENRIGLGDVSISFRNPRYVCVKEAVQYTHGKTRRLEVVVQADSPLYRTNDRHPVYIDGILYISTGRFGECQTFFNNSELEIQERNSTASTSGA